MKMIPCAIPNLIGNEKKYLEECIDTNYVSSVGEFVNRFESKLIELSGATHAVPTNTGTSAISLALIAAGVRPSDLVFSPSYSFIATANAVKSIGAEPYFVDIEEESWSLSPTSIQETLGKDFKINAKGEFRNKTTGQRLAAVIVVFTLGHAGKIDELKKLLDPFGVPLIVDAAAALGVEYKGRNLGSLGDFQTLSFNGNKTFTTGGGGAVLTQDDKLGKLVRHLSSTARTGVAYQHDLVAFNYRMPNLNAAVGLAQLENFETFMARKQDIARNYKKAFEDSVFGELPDAGWCKSAHWLSGLTIPEDFNLTISKFIHALNQVGVEAKPFWVPMHLQEPYKNNPRGLQLFTDKIWEKVVILPCSTSLTSEDQQLVIEKVKNLAKV